LACIKWKDWNQVSKRRTGSSLRGDSSWCGLSVFAAPENSGEEGTTLFARTVTGSLYSIRRAGNLADVATSRKRRRAAASDNVGEEQAEQDLEGEGEGEEDDMDMDV
jgi:hypothetical protein